jgi:23S rRNA pseudoU1915 N3-methylase RlmH
MSLTPTERNDFADAIMKRLRQNDKEINIIIGPPRGLGMSYSAIAMKWPFDKERKL